MQIFVQAKHLHCIEVNENTCFGALKEIVSVKEGLNVDDQVLNFAGQTFEDDALIQSSGISNLSTVNVLGRILGGKVHGSLARAGKVKGQTPKVEPQEKKKKKTGRARRRQQYNRRFANVVPTFGRRRGPNSNF